MKTALEIIRETVEYYAADPKGRRARSDAAGRCYYLMDDGRMCAVGRCLIAPGDMPDDYIDYLDAIDPLLQAEYRGHSIDFWQVIQDLHDQATYWSDSGLTDVGKAYLAELEVTYA